MKDTGLNSMVQRRPLKVIISFITLWSFLFNVTGGDIAWAARTPLEPTRVGSDRPDSPGVLKELHIDRFSLPEYLGHIKFSHKADSDKAVIHIQDAHSNYFAQHKIADILNYLNIEYGINTINLEGGAENYDLSIFTSIPDNIVREKVADNFLKEGLINGAEYFAINNPEKANLWGIEDVRLYIENLNVYRESLQYKEDVEKQLKALTHILNNLKTRIYSKELFELDLKYGAYKAENIEFKEYLTYLIQKARQKAIEIKPYANIYLLQQSLLQEETIDFKKANMERDKLIDRLQKRLSRDAMEELVLKSFQFKTEEISQLEFYVYLTRRSKSAGIDLKEFPEVQKYIIYISMYAAIDKPKVIEEVNDLEERIKEVMYENETQEELAKLSKNLTLLKNIFNVSLTKDDYRYYLENKSSFDMRNYTAFITKHAPLYRIQATLDKEIERVDDYRDNITKFYECSIKRDEAFLKNLKFPAPENKPAVIITGGFHTENLLNLFEKENISYVSIMPNFKNSDGYESPYFRLLAGELTGIQKRIYSVLTSAAPPKSLIQVASLLSSPELRERAWGKELGDTVLRLLVWLEGERASGRNIIVVGQNGEELMRFVEDDLGKGLEPTQVRAQELLAQVAAPRASASGQQVTAENIAKLLPGFTKEAQPYSDTEEGELNSYSYKTWLMKSARHPSAVDFDTLFKLGRRHNILAHGVQLEKGGLTNLLVIMLNGRIAPSSGVDGNPVTYIGLLNNMATMGRAGKTIPATATHVESGAYGPFYVVLSDNIKKEGTAPEGIGEEHHLFYLVPDEATKAVLLGGIQEAFEGGYLSKEQMTVMQERIKTYAEFEEALDHEGIVILGRFDQSRTAGMSDEEFIKYWNLLMANPHKLTDDIAAGMAVETAARLGRYFRFNQAGRTYIFNERQATGIETAVKLLEQLLVDHQPVQVRKKVEEYEYPPILFAFQQAIQKVSEARASASGAISVIKHPDGQVFIEGLGLLAVDKATNWGGWVDMMGDADEAIIKGISQQLFSGEPAMVNIAVSEEMSGQLPQTFLGRAIQVRNALGSLVQEFRVGNMTFNIFLDTEDGRRELLDKIRRSGITKSNRIVTFAYTKSAELQDNSYTVYITGEKGVTATPIGTAGMTGLAILNHFDLVERGAIETDLAESIKLIARGMAAMSGAGVAEDIITEIVKKIAENNQLLSSGLIWVKIRPVDTNEIQKFHEAEAQVLRAL